MFNQGKVNRCVQSGKGNSMCSIRERQINVFYQGKINQCVQPERCVRSRKGTLMFCLGKVNKCRYIYMKKTKFLNFFIL